jgi:hypothetical protein
MYLVAATHTDNQLLRMSIQDKIITYTPASTKKQCQEILAGRTISLSTRRCMSGKAVLQHSLVTAFEEASYLS